MASDDALDGQRESGGAIGESSVVDIAAGGEVSGEGRGFLPHFASAAGVGVVGVIQGIVLDDPEALREQNGEQHGGDLLRTIEAELPQAVGAVRGRRGRDGLDGQSSV